MKNNKIILVVILLIILAVFVFYFLNRKTTTPEATSSVTITSVDGGDALETYEVNEHLSKIENKTNKYSVEIPNTWSIENQDYYQRFLSKGDLTGPDSCLFSATSFSNGMTAEEVVNENEEFSLETINTNKSVVGGRDGFLQTEYSGNQIAAEVAYVDYNNRVYAIGAYYGGKVPSEYHSCHPLFEELLNSFEFTE